MWNTRVVDCLSFHILHSLFFILHFLLVSIFRRMQLGNILFALNGLAGKIQGQNKRSQGSPYLQAIALYEQEEIEGTME